MSASFGRLYRLSGGRIVSMEQVVDSHLVQAAMTSS
jgi:hypothetical protein